MLLPVNWQVYGLVVATWFVSQPSSPDHRNEIIIHGLIVAWGVGQRLSNPLKNPKAEIRVPEIQNGETLTLIIADFKNWAE